MNGVELLLAVGATMACGAVIVLIERGRRRRRRGRCRDVRLGEVAPEKEWRCDSASAAFDPATGRWKPRRSPSARMVDTVLRR